MARTARLLILASCLGACSAKEEAPQSNAAPASSSRTTTKTVKNRPPIAESVQVACAS